MLDFLKERLSVICALVSGTGGGWCMSAVISAPELTNRLVTISIAVSLLLSILISVSLKGRLRTVPGFRTQAIRKGYFILAGFIFSVIVFFIVSDNYTVGIPQINVQGRIDTLTIVKGLYYTSAANAYSAKLLKQNHKAPDDKQLLNDYAYEITKIWDERSLSLSRLLLLLLYSAMIALLTAGVTYGTEILQSDKDK